MWTDTTRKQFARSGLRLPSDFTDLAAARQTSGGTWGAAPLGTAQSVNIHTALKSYTAWAAPLIGQAGRTGVLAPGMAADIAVWDRDPYQVPTAAIKDMKADMTLFRGKLVFERK